MKTKTPITLIAAMAKDRVIGHRNEIPWYCPYDMGFFRKYTMGKVVIMGRKTMESIGGPLEGRKNVVLSQNPSIPYRGISVAHCLTSALKMADRYSQENGIQDIVIIGGSQLYHGTIDMASQVLLTQIPVDVDGDATFPELPNHFSLFKEETKDVTVSYGDVATTMPVNFQRWEVM